MWIWQSLSQWPHLYVVSGFLAKRLSLPLAVFSLGLQQCCPVLPCLELTLEDGLPSAALVCNVLPEHDVMENCSHSRSHLTLPNIFVVAGGHQASFLYLGNRVIEPAYAALHLSSEYMVISTLLGYGNKTWPSYAKRENPEQRVLSRAGLVSSSNYSASN